jgi:hypothetical protein
VGEVGEREGLAVGRDLVRKSIEERRWLKARVEALRLKIYECTCTEIFIYMWLGLLMRPYSYLTPLLFDPYASRNELEDAV